MICLVGGANTTDRLSVTITDRLSAFDEDPLTSDDATEYRSIVGGPDISYAVNRVCQYLCAHRTSYWTAVKQFYATSVLLTHTVCFFSLHRLLSSRVSLTRIGLGVLMIDRGPNLIDWNARKQATVSRSSAEAEYKAVANATAKIIWIQSLLRKLGVSQTQLPVL